MSESILFWQVSLRQEKSTNIRVLGFELRRKKSLVLRFEVCGGFTRRILRKRHRGSEVGGTRSLERLVT